MASAWTFVRHVTIWEDTMYECGCKKSNHEGLFSYILSKLAPLKVTCELMGIQHTQSYITNSKQAIEKDSGKGANVDGSS